MPAMVQWRGRQARLHSRPMKPTQTKPTKSKKSPRRPEGVVEKLSARSADRHVLYTASVQNVEAEIDFVDKTYRKLRGRHAVSLREDFCGTAATSCEWVRRRPANVAYGLDLDAETLEWGRRNNIARLPEKARPRVHLYERDVRLPQSVVRPDAVLAMNFSYWIFPERAQLIEYFSSVRRSIASDGVFFLDFFGGYEAQQEMEEPRKVVLPVDRCAGALAGASEGQRTFTYVWDQKHYNPITGEYHCDIHFRFRDGTQMKRAFSYKWRLWSMPEIRDALRDAGFGVVTVYWEGTEEDGSGNGVFRPSLKGEVCPGWIAYITAEV